jgi:hypothetical protein
MWHRRPIANKVPGGLNEWRGTLLDSRLTLRTPSCANDSLGRKVQPRAFKAAGQVFSEFWLDLMGVGTQQQSIGREVWPGADYAPELSAGDSARHGAQSRGRARSCRQTVICVR